MAPYSDRAQFSLPETVFIFLCFLVLKIFESKVELPFDLFENSSTLGSNIFKTTKHKKNKNSFW